MNARPLTDDQLCSYEVALTMGKQLHMPIKFVKIRCINTSHNRAALIQRTPNINNRIKIYKTPQKSLFNQEPSITSKV